MIKAVIFDYGNVVSLTQTGDCADEMEKMTGIPANIFRSVYDKFRFEFDRGTIDGVEMYRQLLADAGYIEQSKDTEMLKKIALMDMQSWRAYHKDVCDWALSLQKEGFKIGVLSNMPTEFLTYYEKEIPIFNFADYACFSCRVKLIKPEEAIYRVCLDGLGIKAEEGVFFDDIQENIDAGNKVGLHACLWTGLDKAKEDFASIIASTKSTNGAQK